MKGCVCVYGVGLGGGGGQDMIVTLLPKQPISEGQDQDLILSPTYSPKRNLYYSVWTWELFPLSHSFILQVFFFSYVAHLFITCLVEVPFHDLACAFNLS